MAWKVLVSAQIGHTTSVATHEVAEALSDVQRMLAARIVYTKTPLNLLSIARAPQKDLLIPTLRQSIG